MKENRISGGVYLVLDPSMDRLALFKKLEQALKEGIAVVQIWNNWGASIDREKIIVDICAMCHAYRIPVLINNAWELLNSLPLDGVHFDVVPDNYALIKRSIKKDCIIGLTCNNNLSDVEWAEKNALNYISFCSIFPSSTSNSCELVSFDTVKEARQITSMPIFLAGGIQLDNMEKLKGLDYNGVAIISGIMNAVNPAQATKLYLGLLNKKYHEDNNH